MTFCPIITGTRLTKYEIIYGNIWFWLVNMILILVNYGRYFKWNQNIIEWSNSIIPGRNSGPYWPDLTASMVPGSKSSKTARGTYLPPDERDTAAKQQKSQIKLDQIKSWAVYEFPTLSIKNLKVSLVDVCLCTFSEM